MSDITAGGVLSVCNFVVKFQSKKKGNSIISPVSH